MKWQPAYNPTRYMRIPPYVDIKIFVDRSKFQEDNSVYSENNLIGFLRHIYRITLLKWPYVPFLESNSWVSS